MWCIELSDISARVLGVRDVAVPGRRRQSANQRLPRDLGVT